ncbi:hypothetical protein [Belnapia sp. F-4-1]|uniref:hypothetical protein n=1 Tax=Belnapia sp. F-4-1 TaxID=1545443 RepID=UPI001186EDAA|nr:hypothetical protein [Belnapia sp. F-4-1]
MQELNFYASHFERTGFTPAINWYRNLSRNWQAGLGADQTVRVPSMMVSAAHAVVPSEYGERHGCPRARPREAHCRRLLELDTGRKAGQAESAGHFLAHEALPPR